MLIHVDSGQFFKSTNDMKAKANDPQALGSAITYNRRYTLVSMLRLNVDGDDDGNKASTPPAKATPPQRSSELPATHPNDAVNCELMNTAANLTELNVRWKEIPADEKSKQVQQAASARKTQLK